MKKQIIILATAITLLAFLSCSKEKFGTEGPNGSIENAATINPSSQKIAGPAVSLNKNLEGLFEFDGNLKDKTGKLGDAVASIFGADNYTDDRRGVSQSAIKFNGRYGIDIFKVPLSINTSVAAWVKCDLLAVPINYFVTAQFLSPDFAQDNTTYWGVISTAATSGVPSGPMNDQWHHLAATYDGTDLKFYVDGSYVGSSLNKYLGAPYPKGATVNYQAGYTTPPGSKIISSVWHGSLDDLRFYSRVLSAADVQALYVQ
jgi:concanavalin A-like lectin/glucanase superfamily protein